jgi:outer membrane murein-binding lipoprotein Lpp
MKTTQLLTVVVILQALILAGQWLGSPSLVTPAHAQILDAGAQQYQMIKELQTLNGKMDRLVGILESGKLEVHVAGADDNKAGRR